MTDERLREIERRANATGLNSADALDYARALIRAGKCHTADSILTARVLFDPDDSSAKQPYGELAHAYSQSGNYPRAENIAALLIEYDRGNFERTHDYIAVSRIPEEHKQNLERVVRHFKENRCTVRLSRNEGPLNLFISGLNDILIEEIAHKAPDTKYNSETERQILEIANFLDKCTEEYNAAYPPYPEHTPTVPPSEQTQETADEIYQLTLDSSHFFGTLTINGTQIRISRCHDETNTVRL